MTTAVVLVAHGTVDVLEDLPELLTNIRRGKAPPLDLLAEVRRRYEAIGGRSPLNAINRDLAGKLAARVKLPVRLANRLSKPYPREVLEQLAKEGVTRAVALPLAQHSAGVYADAVKAAAREVPAIAEIVAVGNWGRSVLLTRAFADAVQASLPAEPSALVMTAHSVPVSVIEAGDRYERELRGSAGDVVAELARRGVTFEETTLAFQSQGLRGPGVRWLGPDLRGTLEGLAARGRRRVVLAPIGFLADHVEILYDLDIEAKAWADELGIALYRSASLNAGEGAVAALAGALEAVIRG